ncbi:alpha-hydroxy-acid oxidizing protein [Shigella flexneri]
MPATRRRFGADGIVVSNDGGRQLDGVFSLSRLRAASHLPTVKGEITILATAVSATVYVVRIIALGADSVLFLGAYPVRAGDTRPGGRG